MMSCTSLPKFDIIICYCFFFRCKDEHIKREERFQNPETEERLLGFAMFEAELFCHYRVRSLRRIRAITCKNYLLKIYSQHANFLNAI